MSETAKGFLITILFLMVSAVLIWGFILVIRAPNRQPVLETDSLIGGVVVERIGKRLPDGLYRVDYDGQIYLLYCDTPGAAIIEHRPVSKP